MRCRIIERDSWFAFVGSDIYDNNFGVTIGWGRRIDARIGESKWRHVIRIRLCWPVAFRRYH
jgi:hypothetical protein